MTDITGSPAANQAGPKNKSTIREYAESILWALAIALILRTFVVGSFKIPSGSMEDTLLVGDQLLANKFIYGMRIPFTDTRVLKIRDPRRGDVVIFRYPEDRSQDFIKRVIGLPGDEILIRNKNVYINGKPYRDPHEVHKDPQTEQGLRDNFGPVRVPPGSYFMMGDNRDNSRDSRFWGFVSDADLVGLAFIKFWSWEDHSWRIRWGNIGRLID
jgi:signal peptidase I